MTAIVTECDRDPEDPVIVAVNEPLVPVPVKVTVLVAFEPDGGVTAVGIRTHDGAPDVGVTAQVRPTLALNVPNEVTVIVLLPDPFFLNDNELELEVIEKSCTLKAVLVAVLSPVLVAVNV